MSSWSWKVASAFIQTVQKDVADMKEGTLTLAFNETKKGAEVHGLYPRGETFNIR